jgi:TRAP-type uncharacterized transport system substrate-binding protein
MRAKLGRTLRIGAATLLVFLAALAVVLFLGAREPGKIVIATGNAQYHDLAASYRRDLEANGVALELRQTTEGFATLQALVDDASGVTAGFVKGGLVGSLQGRLASEQAKEWRASHVGQWLSVGRLFYEPIWVFTRSDTSIRSLSELQHKRILTGPRLGGTRRVATQLLAANGVKADNASLLEEDLNADAAQLRQGKADAAFVIVSADADRIQKLLRVPDIRLMNFAAEADAYTTRYPALTKLVLREGSVEFNPLLPAADITLLATSVALVVRTDMHPALVSLLTYAVVHNPQEGFDHAGDPILFYKAGDFPSPHDPEFKMSSDALLVYKTGELPLLLRVLAPFNKRWGLPFSLTAFANAHGAQTILLLIPVLAVVLPLVNVLPKVYAWSVRRRLLYWYRQLTKLERSLDIPDAERHLRTKQLELERIDTAVSRIRIPIYFADQLYDLRGHIDLVRQRLAARPLTLSTAAQ